LPVPSRPREHVASLAATRSSCENTSRITALSPIIEPNAERSDAGELRVIGVDIDSASWRASSAGPPPCGEGP